MVLKVVKIVVVFVVLLWVVSLFFAPSVKGPGYKGGGLLFSKDLAQKVSQGQLVIVDKDESDKLIQEDLATHDLVEALTFARYKSEVLERPLYIENAETFGKPTSVARVDPSDRQAWQHLILLEINLKSKYARRHPNDIEGYTSEKALDLKRVPQAMQEFIDDYPDSYVVTTALAYIEYSLCLAGNDCDRAIKIYNKLESKYPDSQVLGEFLPKYRERAIEHRRNKRNAAEAA